MLQLTEPPTPLKDVSHGEQLASGLKPMIKREFTTEEAKEIGDKIGVDWALTNLEQFRLGLAIELEHGTADPRTNVTGDDTLLTGKIAWAHLNEIPDYYTRLQEMEREAGS